MSNIIHLLHWIGKKRVYQEDSSIVLERIIDIGEDYVTVRTYKGRYVKTRTFEYDDTDEMIFALETLDYQKR